MLKKVYILSCHTENDILKPLNTHVQACNSKNQAMSFLKQWYNYFNKDDYTIIKWVSEKGYTKSIYNATIKYNNSYEIQVLHVTFIISNSLVYFKED